MTLELLTAKVGHERFTPRSNKFLYSVYYVICPVTDTSPLTPRLFSFDRFNVLSVFTRDHGARSHESWRSWIGQQCADHGIVLSSADTVVLIAHPRLFGFAFNPISYWLVHDAETKKLKAVLCEVRNTFGDDHNYFLAHADGREILSTDIFVAQKHLYVSPFNRIEGGSYTFTFAANDSSFKSVIDFYQDGTRTLNTYMGGTRRPLTSAAIIRAVLTYPLMTFMVLYRIHWQALRLYIKRVPHTLRLRPEHTSGDTTRGQDAI